MGDADAGGMRNGQEKKIALSEIAKPQIVEMIRNAGSSAMNETVLQKHLDAGAPTNADGTMNLLHYVAWLIRANEK